MDIEGHRYLRPNGAGCGRRLNENRQKGSDLPLVFPVEFRLPGGVERWNATGWNGAYVGCRL